MKCHICKEEKDFSLFKRHSGYVTICLDCRLKNNSQLSAKEKIYAKQVLYKKQNGKCLICFRKLNKDASKNTLDHCHKTGLIRGLLCSYCNKGLGFFNDNVDNLQRAIMYLSFNQELRQSIFQIADGPKIKRIINIGQKRFVRYE